VILLLGVASPFFTGRMEPSTNNVLKQMERVQNAGRPAIGAPAPSPASDALPWSPVASASLASAASERGRP